MRQNLELQIMLVRVQTKASPFRASLSCFVKFGLTLNSGCNVKRLGTDAEQISEKFGKNGARL